MSPQVRRGFGLAGALLAAFAIGCGNDPGPRGDERYAFLALGDTGLPPSSHDGQRAVASALAFEDQLRPVESLVLLGDNFYPRGLERGELAQRIRHNLVSPYCRFVSLGPRSTELDTSCSPTRKRGPIWAVLGNHDHEDPESALLQRTVVGDFVANWHVPAESVAVRSLAAGIQLILVDSQELLRGDPARLARAVAEAPGPWRILVAHIPLVAGYGERDGVTEAIHGVTEAIARSGVPVQLTLAGHEHNLQAFVLEDRKGLAIIAGGGSNARKIHPGPGNRVFAEESRGFARVAILATEPERMRVELIAAPKLEWPGAAPIRRVATYEVALSGDVNASGPSVRP